MSGVICCIYNHKSGVGKTSATVIGTSVVFLVASFVLCIFYSYGFRVLILGCVDFIYPVCFPLVLFLLCLHLLLLGVNAICMAYPNSRFSLIVARINSLLHKVRNRVFSPPQGSILGGLFDSRGKLRRSLALNSTYICALGWTCGTVIFLLPVFKAWHTGISYQTLFGILPNTDGPHVFTGAMQLLHTGQIIDYSTRRPINSAFLAVRIAICGGNVQGAILLQALFLGLCCSSAARVIFRDLGSLSGIAFFLLLFQFGIWSVANMCTEALGLSLGGVGLFHFVARCPNRQ